MVNFKRLTDRAKDVVEKRGGKDALKEDMQELRTIAKGKGSLKEKAMAAKDALKDPGERGPARTGAEPPAGPAAPSRPGTGTAPTASDPTAADTPAEPGTGAAPTGPDPTAADSPQSPRTK